MTTQTENTKRHKNHLKSHYQTGLKAGPNGR